MPKTLKHSLSSDYLNAARLLSPKKQRKRIVVYVESYNDVGFWREILNNFENDERYFEVMIPSTQNLTHGKKSVLLQSLQSSQLGENLIACVDSDYDFLMQGVSETSRQVNDCPYVIQTYCYAIENYWCYAESLHEVCVQATLNDHHIFDFVQFLKEYSEIVYPLFMWNIFFYRCNDIRTYPMRRLNETTAFKFVDIRNPQKAFNKLRTKVERELHYWQDRFPDHVEYVEQQKEQLKELGVTPENTYLYMQGHHIFDNVVMKMLIPVCVQLRREQEDFIKAKAVHEKQCENELTGYENSSLPVEVVLRKNTKYKELFLFQWVLEDLKNIFPSSSASLPEVGGE